MHGDLVELGWTEEHWNRLYGAVTEEAQKARVAAQIFKSVGGVDRTTVAVPPYTLSAKASSSSTFSPQKLTVDSDPTLFLTKIAINVQLRSREMADPELNAALTVFRRAANYVARIEDSLIFNGRPGPNALPPFGLNGIPAVYKLTGDGGVEGVFPFLGTAGARQSIAIKPPRDGDKIVVAIIEAIDKLDSAGQLGPYACVLSPKLFEAICTPNPSLVLPRDRILPFLQAPLLRSSSIQGDFGAVIALSADPLELVIADDIQLRYLQTNEDAQRVFQVSERVALRIKETAAIAIMY
jgi:uncharacterized linocin/CFP29 family protein